MNTKIFAKGFALAGFFSMGLAVAAPNLVVNITPTNGTGASVDAPGIASWQLTLYNSAPGPDAADTASNVVLTHAFGSNGLYDTAVTCTTDGGVAAPTAIDIDDGYDAGTVSITLASLPPGGLDADSARLDCVVTGVVRGYPRGSIVHTVDAVADGGVNATQAQTTSTLIAAEVNTSVAKELLSTPPAEGFAWGTPIAYRATYTNEGDRPLPRALFRDRHTSALNNTRIIQYQGFGTPSFASEVMSCTITGAAPAGVVQDCPWVEGDTYSNTSLTSPLPEVYWADVLYPGQSVVVEYTEIYTTPPSCTVDVFPTIPNVASFNFVASNNPLNTDVPGTIGRLFPRDVGSNPHGSNNVALGHRVNTPMRDVPRCRSAEIRLNLDKERLTPHNVTDLQAGADPTRVRYRLTVQNVSSQNFVSTADATPLQLQLSDNMIFWTERGPVSFRGEIVRCEGTGDATCSASWAAASEATPVITSGSPTTVTGHASTSGSIQAYNANSQFTLPQGESIEIDLDLVVTAVGTCAQTWASNIMGVLPVQPGATAGDHITDGTSQFDLYRVIGNTGGPLSASLVSDRPDPAERFLRIAPFGPAQGERITTVSLRTDDPDCKIQADPGVAGILGLAPVQDGFVAYDVTVTNSAGSLAISGVELRADLAAAGIDLTAPGLDDLLVSCLSADDLCPGGVTPGAPMCSGAACPISGTELLWSDGALPANGGSFTLRIYGRFTGTQGQPHSLTATIAPSASADYQDTNAANNTAVVNAAAASPGVIRIRKLVAGDGFSGTEPFTVIATCNGSVAGSAQLMAGGAAVDIPVPIGATCTLEETVRAALPIEWVWDGTEAYSSASDHFTAPNEVTVPGGEVVEVIVTNTTARGQASLVIGKQLVGAPAGYVPATDFTIAVQCPGPQAQDVQLADGASHTVDVNSGACTVTEDTAALPEPPVGYQWAAPQFTPTDNVTLPHGASATVTVINTLVQQESDIAVSKAVDAATVTVGGNAVFTVTVANLGPDAATNLTITDVLPDGLELQTATPSQGDYDDATGLWTVGELAVGSTATLAIETTVTAVGEVTNTARLDGLDQVDPDASNDEGSATVRGNSAAVVPVPLDARWMLLLMAVLLAGFAGVRQRRSMR